MRGRILILSLIFLNTVRVSAARDTLRYAISVTPQYLAINAIKTGFEYRISMSNWIGLSAEFYYGTISAEGANGKKSMLGQNYGPGPKADDSLSGIGIALEDKLFLNPKKRQYGGFYFKYGISMTFLSIKFNDYTYQPYTNDGLVYYKLTNTEAINIIEKLQGFAGFGYSFKIFRGLRTDIFAGWGINKIFSQTNLPGYRIYERSIYDYEYPGGHPVLTFALGYVF